MEQLVSESAEERRCVEAELTTQTANEASKWLPYLLGLQLTLCRSYPDRTEDVGR
jgi:hypothetical protein